MEPRKVLALLATGAAMLATMGTSPTPVQVAPPWTEIGVIADGETVRVLDSAADRRVWRVGVTVSSPDSGVELTAATVRLGGAAFSTSAGDQVVLTVQEVRGSQANGVPVWEPVAELVLDVAESTTLERLDSVTVTSLPDCSPLGPSVCSLEYRFALESAAATPLSIEPLIQLAIEGVRATPTVTFEVEELGFSELDASP